MVLRLLHTTSLGLTNFWGTDLPEYAILSHKWLDGQEISYEEIIGLNETLSHPAFSKLGYSKIVKTCEVARGLGLDYVWVDTCCINKSSDAELSEAINSMFKWYQSAKFCIVYLGDLPPTSNLEDRMPKCVWFRRGWCLQELIAPRDSRFYNCRWDYLGNKKHPGLLDLVSRISGVNKAVLLDAEILPTLSVAQKMSWSAHRETTRPEDLAYCLLGIFDVNMPLLYGEGSKAFLRLQEEIIKRSNDLSIFAWEHTTRSPRWEVDNSVLRIEGEDYANNPCDLLAESASEFSNCANLVLRTTGSRHNIAFSMTNNGILFSRMNLRVDFDNGCYLLPLHCHEEDSPMDGIYLRLKKVGPELFVRLKTCRWENLFQWNERVNGYVFSKLTPESKAFLRDCHCESVQLRSPSCSNHSLHDSILEVSPSETWDLSNLTFLHDDDQRFAGHVKFHGRKLYEALGGSLLRPLDDIHLLCGTALDIPDSHHSTHVRGTLWVFLCWASDWERVSTSTVQSHGESSSLRRGSEIIKADVISVGDTDSEYFRINISICPA